MPDKRWTPPGYPEDPKKIFKDARDGTPKAATEPTRTNFAHLQPAPALTPRGSLEQQVHMEIERQKLAAAKEATSQRKQHMKQRKGLERDPDDEGHEH